MSEVSIVAVGTLTVLLAALMVTRMSAERREKSRAWQERKRALSQLRLSKMLKHLGADLDQYARKVPFADVQEAMKICADCRQTERCDHCLRDGMRMDPHFCPNYDRLLAHSKLLVD